MEPMTNKSPWTSVIVFGYRWRATFTSFDGVVQVIAEAEEGQAILCERNTIRGWQGLLSAGKSLENVMEAVCELYGGRRPLRDDEPAYKLTDELGKHVGPFKPFEDEEDLLYQVVLPVCKACLVGDGKVCHSPGCMLIRREVWGPVCEALGAPGAEDVQEELLAEINRRYGPLTEISEEEFVEAEHSLTEVLDDEAEAVERCFVTDRRPGSQLCEGHQDLVVADPSDDPITVTPMNVQVKRIGRDRLILVGTPDDEETRPEGFHHCDYMGCGTHHVVGRALLLKVDGDPQEWNRTQAMARQLDAVAFPWGPEPLSVGDYWILWGSSGQRSAVHFDPLNGVAYVDADNQPDDDNRFWPESRCRFRDRYWPDNPLSVSQADDVEQLDHSRATPVTPEQLRATAMKLLAQANVLDEETHGRDLDAAGRTLTDWGEILKSAARGCRDEAYGGGSLQWLAEELQASGYPAEPVGQSFPPRTRQQIVDGELNVFALDLLFKSAEQVLKVLVGIDRIAGTTDYRGNRWQWSVELITEETG